MDKNAVFMICKNLRCCDACCLRYVGVKNPNAYENAKKYALKYQDTMSVAKIENETNENPLTDSTTEDNESVDTNTEGLNKINEDGGTSEDKKLIDSKTKVLDKMNEDGRTSPLAKRCRMDNMCVSCLGILQEETWSETFDMVQEQLDKKCYSCNTFACALSAPISTLLREKAITLIINKAIPDYDPKILTSLKEAWKFSFGNELSSRINKALDSGAVCPLLITVNIEYPEDIQELEILKTLSPSLFEERNKHKRRFTVEFTRRSVEQALANMKLEALQAIDGWRDGLPSVCVKIKCVSVVTEHTPFYLGGRYIKLSRSLPQSPWILKGERMMESSVQEIIFEPIAKIYRLSAGEAEYRFKFMSAGREDVDVRCLGDGRPFAIEITDPTRQLSADELQRVCEDISSSGKVIVKNLVYVTKDDLTQLKQGEETKCKTYEALCIKLSHSDSDDCVANGDTPIAVTEQDIANINSYKNTEDEDARVVIAQKTPIRVLHRRPLHTRSRRIYELTASVVPDHPQLFTVRVRTEAGTYVKEWAHGEARRTRPSLGDAIRATTDILALDVTGVHLAWPSKAHS